MLKKKITKKKTVQKSKKKKNLWPEILLPLTLGLLAALSILMGRIQDVQSNMVREAQIQEKSLNPAIIEKSFQRLAQREAFYRRKKLKNPAFQKQQDSSQSLTARESAEAKSAKL